MWSSSANPVRPFTEWLKETKEYIQFVNPGDLRVAEQTCGSAGCHAKEVLAVRTSMMTTAPCCGRRRSTTTAGIPIRTRASARAIRRTASRSASTLIRRRRRI